jgi:hypothetical protein
MQGLELWDYYKPVGYKSTHGWMKSLLGVIGDKIKFHLNLMFGFSCLVFLLKPNFGFDVSSVAHLGFSLPSMVTILSKYKLARQNSYFRGDSWSINHVIQVGKPAYVHLELENIKNFIILVIWLGKLIW